MLSIKKITGVLGLSLVFCGFTLFAGPALKALDPCDTNGDGQVSTQEAIQCGSNGAAGTTQTSDQASTNLDNTILSIVNYLSIAVGIVAVVMIIMGGFRYITSGGKQESIVGAKNTITYAIVGLVIVALAQVIARFTLNTVTTSSTQSTSSSTQSTTQSGNNPCVPGKPC
ncbi:MAG: pilin [Candidatus Saccharimonadales bacterium]|jgi:hypothetical protein